MSYGRAAFAASRLRQDNWQSTLGGLGGSNDRGRVDRVQFVDALVLDDYTLSSVYRNLWLARRVVEDPIEDALRDGWGTEDELPDFTRLNYEVHQEGAIERACAMAALKGGAGVYVGYKHSGGPESLLQPPPDGAEVAFIEVFDKFQLTGHERSQDVDSADYDRPQVWQVTSGNRRMGLKFHTSRLIKFPGVPRASTLTTTHQDRDWGDSVLQAVWPDVTRYGVFWQVMTHLLSLKSIGVLKLKGLIKMLASQNREDAEARIDLLNEAMGLTRLMLLDADGEEEYTRQDVSFTDLPALLQELQMATAGAVREPVTRLFGRSPAGMNATGESDLENWYSRVEAYRTRYVKPGLEAVVNVCERRSDYRAEFKPMWQLSELEEQDLRLKRAQADERLWTMGVVSDAEIRRAIHEGVTVESIAEGEPPAELTRAVTTIAVVPPGVNASAPRDPTAPDEPAPAKTASPFPPKGA